MKIIIAVFLILRISSTFSQQDKRHTTISTSKFDFSINFWVNMHHFLYHESYLRSKKQLGPEVKDVVKRFTSDERKVLELTMDFYENEIIAKHFFYSDFMTSVLDYLTDGRDELFQPEDRHLINLKKRLEDFQGIYQKYFWPRHYKLSALILNESLGFVKKLESPISMEFNTLFKNQWQMEKIKVDLSIYGALIPNSLKNVPYTNLEPTHIVMISSDYMIEVPEIWVELLFHEAAHHMVFYNKGVVAKTINEVSKTLDINPPRGLWHAYLFYIVGKVMQKQFTELSCVYKEIYMERFGVFSSIYIPLKELDEYISGKKSLDEVTMEIFKKINNG